MRTLILFFVALLAVAVSAEELQLKVFKGVTPEKEEIIAALRVPKGIDIRSPDTRPAVSLDVVTFGFDSAELTDEARSALNVIGEAFVSKDLAENRIRIEGHTDATGPADYNKALSLRRANAVKEYLMNNFGIDEERVPVVGKGEEELINTEQPGSAENRRVQFVNLS